MTLKNCNGFSLIEVIVALGVFSFGLFASFMLHTTIVRGNANAHIVSDATNWGADRMEMLVTMPYDSDTNGIDDDGDGTIDELDEEFIDGDGTNNGTGGLEDTPAKRSGDPDLLADNFVVSPDGQYTVYWNVAENYPQANMKTVRVIARNARLNSDLRLTTVKVLGR